VDNEHRPDEHPKTTDYRHLLCFSGREEEKRKQEKEKGISTPDKKRFLEGGIAGAGKSGEDLFLNVREGISEERYVSLRNEGMKRKRGRARNVS